MKQSDDIDSILFNNCPSDIFLGFTPTELHYLLYETFGDKSPIQFCNDLDDTTLNQIPLFRIAEEYLKIIQRDKQIKLTPLGALPKKVMVELYDKKILLDEHIESGLIKLWREQDCISIMSARLTVELAGFVRKANGKVVLTKKGERLLKSENRINLFKQFFQTFTEKFNWGFNDLYPKEPIGQLGWAFSVYMLCKFGDQTNISDYYADIYLKVFPTYISFFEHTYSTTERQFNNCYSTRTFDRFFLWFGFVTVERKKHYLDLESDKFTATDLVKRIFGFDE
jgi:hypothetical protein